MSREMSESERQQQRRLTALSLHLPHVGVLRAPWNVVIISHNLVYAHTEDWGGSGLASGNTSNTEFHPTPMHVMIMSECS